MREEGEAELEEDEMMAGQNQDDKDPYGGLFKTRRKQQGGPNDQTFDFGFQDDDDVVEEASSQSKIIGNGHCIKN